MRLGEIQGWLAKRGIRLTKSLGQNFLHDGNQLRRIIRAAELAAGDRVLEIGPGLGALTGHLLEGGARVLAVEKDRRLADCLRERFGASDGLELVVADALDYLKRPDLDWVGWKMVSNLPYSVASAILVELAMRVDGPKRMVVTLQWEVGRRLVAEAGAGDYGILTLLMLVHYEVSEWFKIPAGCFFPVPDVDSACVRLDRRSEPLVTEAGLETYVSVVKRSFSQRRKMMLKLLRTDWPAQELELVFGELGLSRSVRAEMVTVGDFAALTGRLREVMGLGK
jgi:16S rRNA (adenine1518-N6/adenine1519-N6)-dimethyltransferase